METVFRDSQPGEDRAPRITYERIVCEDSASPLDGFLYNPQNLVVAVKARANIELPFGPGAWVLLSIDSPGCYGVEVKNERDPYLEELYEEELSAVKDMLRGLAALEI